ncbi:hypothetical protein [Thermococcus sp. GR6]|uniref:hypothetical protein n=1 Tax=Thermococcus sp. GR6 TaxID=1638256 RepID=UPI00142FD411|nr:hypothetical protein [Thermococcus sp. GR6]NJE42652.1 hypothetical protein [Thermococcus sp. GR6]
MGNKAFVAIILALIIFGWIFLGLSAAAQQGLLSKWDSKPDDLSIQVTAEPVENGTLLVFGWEWKKDSIVSRLRDEKDFVIILVPSDVSIRGHDVGLVSPYGNVTLETVEGTSLLLALGTIHLERQGDYINPQKLGPWDVYFSDFEVRVPPYGSGRLELPLEVFSNRTRDSTIPVIFVYIHTTGSEELRPKRVEVDVEIKLAEDAPLSNIAGMFPIRGVVSWDAAALERFILPYYEEVQGGWVKVDVFNVTLDCGGE